MAIENRLFFGAIPVRGTRVFFDRESKVGVLNHKELKASNFPHPDEILSEWRAQIPDEQIDDRFRKAIDLMLEGAGRTQMKEELGVNENQVQITRFLIKRLVQVYVGRTYGLKPAAEFATRKLSLGELRYHLRDGSGDGIVLMDNWYATKKDVNRYKRQKRKKRAEGKKVFIPDPNLSETV